MHLALPAMASAFLLAGACGSRARDREPPRDDRAGPRRMLKGQLHVHTGNSGDSQTPPAAVAHWYAEHGFDFIVFTDHNVVTRQDSDEILTIPGVELTQNLDTCEPPPPAGRGCLLHINALFVGVGHDGAIGFGPLTSLSRVDVYQRALDLSQQLGAVAQLNHPNMGWAVDPALAVELGRRGVALVEIANQNEVDSSAGDREHPSAEALWDSMLSAGLRVHGVATDDAHHYGDADAVRASGQEAFVGDLGYVMVRAERNVESIRGAIARGDFYATTGVRLARADVQAGALTVEVEAETRVDGDGAADPEITFIGTGGRVLRRSRGSRASFDLAGAPPGYVRATVTDGRGRRAWVQPVRTP